MDGWPTTETDVGRAVMKTPAIKAKVNVVKPAPVATTLPMSTLTITWQRSTRSDLHALDAATRIVLISITYQSQRAGSVAWLVRRSLGHCPSHISS